MATSKARLAEQIQRIYARYSDKENIDRSLDSREIYLLIEQAMNRVLKAQTFERFTDGYINIPECQLTVYSDVLVLGGTALSYVPLPAIPLSLPMDMGIWKVCPAGKPYETYIPISSQDWSVMGVAYTNGTQTDGINTSYLEQQIGYYIDNKRIYFTKNIDNTRVDIYLLVNDFTQVGDLDLLPLSAEYELDVMQEVFRMLGMGQISQAEIVANENSNT